MSIDIEEELTDPFEGWIKVEGCTILFIEDPDETASDIFNVVYSMTSGDIEVEVEEVTPKDNTISGTRFRIWEEVETEAAPKLIDETREGE